MKLFNVILHCGFISLCWCRLNEEVTVASANESIGPQTQCFHGLQEDCPPLSDPCRCKKVSNNTVVCCNVDKVSLNVTCGSK